MLQYLILTGQVKNEDLFLAGLMILVVAGLCVLAGIYFALSAVYDWLASYILTKIAQRNDPHQNTR